MSFCRNSAYIRVRFWRHVKIESILSRCFCNSKRKYTAYNWGVTYQTVHYGYNRKEKKRRNVRKCIYQIIQYRGGSKGERLGRSFPLKPTKVMILYNSETNFGAIRPFCHPLFCHSSVVKYTKPVMRLDYHIIMK